MPAERKKAVQLSELSSFTSTNLTHFLKQHNATTCDSCKYIYNNENCIYVQQWKKALEELSDTAKIQIFNKVHHNLYGGLNWKVCNGESGVLKERNRRFDMLCYHIDVCMYNSLPISYNSIEDIPDMFFVKKFGSIISGITWHREINDIDCLISTFHFTPKLAIVDFKKPVISDNLLELIGKYCYNVREIKGQLSNDEFTFLGYYKLMFQDYQTIQEPNKCCQTLEVIELDSFDDDREIAIATSAHSYFGEELHFFDRHFPDENSMKRCLNIMFDTLPKLRSVGKEITVNCILDALDRKTEIDQVWLASMKSDTVEKMKMVLPELKVLHIHAVKQDIKDLQNLRQIESLIKLRVAITNDSILYDGILASEWSTLKCLEIEGPWHYFLKLGDLKISAIARTLPNLESLVAVGVKKITWDGKTVFQNLKFIRVTGSFCDDYDLQWFQSFSETIEILDFSDFYRDDESVSIDKLISLGREIFPKLKKMHITTLSYEEDTVRNFVMECPLLSEIGYFDCEEDDELKQLSDYLHDNNIDCRLLPFE